MLCRTRQKDRLRESREGMGLAKTFLGATVPYSCICVTQILTRHGREVWGMALSVGRIVRDINVAPSDGKHLV